MAQITDLPNGEPTADSTANLPRSAALWLALQALHHLRFDYPSREYFTNEKLDTAITLTWVEYMTVALEEMSN